jgi:hypothetical protein
MIVGEDTRRSLQAAPFSAEQGEPADHELDETLLGR